MDSLEDCMNDLIQRNYIIELCSGIFEVIDNITDAKNVLNYKTHTLIKY